MSRVDHVSIFNLTRDSVVGHVVVLVTWLCPARASHVSRIKVLCAIMYVMNPDHLRAHLIASRHMAQLLRLANLLPAIWNFSARLLGCVTSSWYIC